jgi:ferredoxin-NADP reductase
VAGAALPGRLSWLLATVVETRRETARVRRIVLSVPGWPGHRAGQHVDVRLTAQDGYEAQRSYSLASPPAEDHLLELTVERLEDGEVSPYLVDELVVGDEIELRGPIGGFFVWEAALGGPLMLIGGGSGIVPLRAILRHRAAIGSAVPARLLYSARSQAELIYREELEHDGDSTLEVAFTLTREQPPGWSGYRRRIDDPLLAQAGWAPSERPLTYLCGPTGFVEAAADGLVRLGHDQARIRTERFGASG